MANLKLDLKNKLNDKKFYAEVELIRLAQDPAMNYKKKIKSMKKQLGLIALLNADIGLVEQYFPEPQAAPEAGQAPVQADAGQPVQQPVAEAPKAEAPKAEAPKAKVHQGQSHGEG